MRCCSKRAPTGIRNRALITVLWRCGLRLGEALALRPKDIDLASGTLVVQHGKGDKRRVGALDAGTAAVLERWLDARKKHKINGSAPIFCTLDGESVQQSYVRHLLPRLDKRVHAHALRHSFAVELEREGAPISTIRDLLGHSSAAMTDRYLRRAGAGYVVAFARDRRWPASE